MTATVKEEVTLDLQGMTCASCAARIERKLNKLGGSTRRSTPRTQRLGRNDERLDGWERLDLDDLFDDCRNRFPRRSHLRGGEACQPGFASAAIAATSTDSHRAPSRSLIVGASLRTAIEDAGYEVQEVAA